MARFHIGKSGKPATCNAKKGNCPLGGEGDHYPTKQQAQQAVEQKLSQQNNVLQSGKKSANYVSSNTTENGVIKDLTQPFVMTNEIQQQFKPLQKENNKKLRLTNKNIERLKENPTRYERFGNGEERNKKLYEIRAEILKPDTNQETINRLAKQYREYREKLSEARKDYDPVKDKEAEEKFNKQYESWKKNRDYEIAQLKKEAIEQDDAQKFLRAKSEEISSKRSKERKMYEDELEKDNPDINVMKSTIYNEEQYKKQWKDINSYTYYIENEGIDNYLGPEKASELRKFTLDD